MAIAMPCTTLHYCLLESSMSLALHICILQFDAQSIWTHMPLTKITTHKESCAKHIVVVVAIVIVVVVLVVVVVIAVVFVVVVVVVGVDFDLEFPRVY